MITFTIIESPYAGDIEGNLRYVRDAMADCFARGEIPLRRALAIAAEHAVTLLEPVIVQTACYEDRGITPGMEKGLERSLADGVPVVFRKLEGWS